MELLGHVEEGNLVCVYNMCIYIYTYIYVNKHNLCLCVCVIIIYQRYTLAIIYQTKFETAGTLES